MVDLSFGPGPDRRPDLGDPRQAYLALSRRKRQYSGILLILLIALLSGGFHLAQDRNAGDFLSGLHMLGAFPSEILSEAWANRANLPGYIWHFLPSLLETINIAAVSTLIGGICAALLAVLSTRGLALWPRLTPLFRRMMDAFRAIPEIVIALVLIFILGGGPVPAVIAIALHTSGQPRRKVSCSTDFSGALRRPSQPSPTRFVYCPPLTFLGSHLR